MNAFSDTVFEEYRQLINAKLGIYLNGAKRELLRAKLDKLLRRYGIDSYQEYYNRLTREHNPEDWIAFSDEITINKTDFFREVNHFDFIRYKMKFIMERNPRINSNFEIRIWSAGCSTGEEPYTLAMVVREALGPGFQLKILATDISYRVLSIAQQGNYPGELARYIEPYYFKKYFHHDGPFITVHPELKRCIAFRQFNLMDPFFFKNSFDIIFCRNVMIYFEPTVQESLINKFYQVLTPGGLLFIGHSETLSNKQTDFHYLQPTIYQR